MHCKTSILNMELCTFWETLFWISMFLMLCMHCAAAILRRPHCLTNKGNICNSLQHLDLPRRWKIPLRVSDARCVLSAAPHKLPSCC